MYTKKVVIGCVVLMVFVLFVSGNFFIHDAGAQNATVPHEVKVVLSKSEPSMLVAVISRDSGDQVVLSNVQGTFLVYAREGDAIFDGVPVYANQSIIAGVNGGAVKASAKPPSNVVKVEIVPIQVSVPLKVQDLK